MKLYHHPLSSNARKAIMAASLLGAEMELVLVDLKNGKNKTPEYLKINPMGKVPTLVDGDLTLWESHAIMQYLADKTPGNALYPGDLAMRAEVNRWLFWGTAHWSAAIAIIVNQNLLKKQMGRGDPDPTLVSFAEGEFKRFAKVLDDRLASTDYVAGRALTLADLALSAPLMYAVPAKIPVQPFANIQNWFGRIQDLDAWKKTNPPS
jgi:glutathione S-transferase